RTAVGTFGGTLKDHTPTQLGAMVVREAAARAGVGPTDVHHVAFGHVINTEPRDMYLARVGALDGGLDKSTPAVTVNRPCGSGLQAIVTCAQSILLGDADVAPAGGAAVLSRRPYNLPAPRFGQPMGHGRLADVMAGPLHDTFETIHIGVTSENVAAKYGITREDQDKLAVESHGRAAAAIAEGRFRDQILPIEIKSRKGTVVFDTDEHVRNNAS